MAEEIITEVVTDPVEKLYRNASKKLDVGDINNFRRLLGSSDTRKAIYDDLVSAYGDTVKQKIGQDVNEFTAQYGGIKKNKLERNNFFTRFRYWWTISFIPCFRDFKYVITG